VLEFGIRCLRAWLGGLRSPAAADSDVDSIEAGSIEVCQHWTESLAIYMTAARDRSPPAPISAVQTCLSRTILRRGGRLLNPSGCCLSFETEFGGLECMLLSHRRFGSMKTIDILRVESSHCASANDAELHSVHKTDCD
jgi:hypothetical protein